jgi:AraC-like DNA-binding protein
MHPPLPPPSPLNPWRTVVDGFRPEHVAVTTRSREEAIARLSGQLSPYRIKLLGHSDAFAARFLAANDLAGLQLSTLGFGTEVELEIATADDHLLVTAQVEGHSAIASQGLNAQGGAGFIVIDSTPQPVVKQFSADSYRVNLRVPRARLDAAWASLTGTLVNAPLVFHPFVPDTVVRQHWHSHLRLLMDYGLQPDIVAARQAEAITESVLLALLMEFPHSHSRRLEVSPARAGADALQKATAFIDALKHEPLSLQDIARECGISVRSLSDLFRREHGISPMKYVAEVRLQAARRLLTGRKAGLTVAEVATACGFSGFGRFSAVYRSRFGELPSETLARR